MSVIYFFYLAPILFFSLLSCVHFKCIGHLFLNADDFSDGVAGIKRIFDSYVLS